MARSRDDLVRVGHKGAGRLAPPNSLAALRAAPGAGLDMVEFDVVRRPRDGALVLAYSPLQAAATPRATLADALDLLATPSLAGLRLDVDLKQAGIEAGVARALRDAGLTARALVTARRPEALARVRAQDAVLRLGWSLRWPWHARLVGERTVVDAIARARAEGRCEALMLHHSLVTPATVAAAGDAEVFAWTVNRRERLGRLAALGVTGVVTDDPRLFD